MKLTFIFDKYIYFDIEKIIKSRENHKYKNKDSQQNTIKHCQRHNGPRVLTPYLEYIFKLE